VALCLAGEALGQKQADLALLTAPLPVDDERKQKPLPQPWSHGPLLPVRVILRDFAARGLPAPGARAAAKHLWDFIAAELEAAQLGDYAPLLLKDLRQSGGLLLLDGLDEVPAAETRRAQLKQAVEDFAASFPKCRLLVTGRTYAYQQQDWRLAGFTEAVLAPFSRGQIRQFVQRWYAHLAALRGLNAEDAQGRAALLENAIFGGERLLGLAERPLLLTLMASLHAWRGGSLPEKREELYADTVDLLLDWWERPKVVRDAQGRPVVQSRSLSEWLKVDRQQVRALLAELAFQAHAGQPSLTGTADLRAGDLVDGLLRLSQNPDVNPALLLEHLSQRAGLLIPRGVGVYTFPHRTFQEYLAACYLTDHDYPEQLAGLACRDFQRWREVALLAGAKAGRGSAAGLWSLVDALCYDELKPGCPAAQEWGAHLAGQALAESVDLSRVGERQQPKLARVQHGLVRVLESGQLPALERARAGDTLAALGDPRFDPQRWRLPKDDTLGFIEIPAGPFLMGSDQQQDPQAYGIELPQHTVDLPGYWIARYPVTVAQFAAFTAAGGYAEPRYWPEAQAAGFWSPDGIKGYGDDAPRRQPLSLRAAFMLPNHPVVGVTWYEMLAYNRWLDEQLRAYSRTLQATSIFWQKLAAGELYVTLPSEAEWEKAARGMDGRVYPWGPEFDPNLANAEETGLGATSAVGCFPAGASPYGALDLSGNVWEWTRSLWGENYRLDYPYPYTDRLAAREDLAAPADVARVQRGGSFYNGSRLVRCAYRRRYGPVLGGGYGGFRLAVCVPSNSAL
jgi:formylglycine-generating enzyme required for sulfatase activity